MCRRKLLAAIVKWSSGLCTIAVGFHGYTGWRENGDRPLALYVEGRKVMKRNVTAFAAVDLGLSKSTSPVAVSAGLRIQFKRNYRR